MPTPVTNSLPARLRKRVAEMVGMTSQLYKPADGLTVCRAQTARVKPRTCDKSRAVVA